MDNELPTHPSPRGKKKSIVPRLNARIIVSFALLGLGFAAINYGNFLAYFRPSYFGFYGSAGLTLYYIIQNLLPPLGFLLIGIAAYLLVSLIISNIRSGIKSPQEDLNALRERVAQEPDKVEPIWDLGRGNLQQYFNRNLRQITNIFWLSVAVMIVGFILIVAGIIDSFVSSSAAFAPALIGSLAGIITEFIGATFLFIYRSTVQQATNYMKTLERINSVGMATKILDTFSNESRELRDETKAELVKLLLTQNTEQKEEVNNK